MLHLRPLNAVMIKPTTMGQLWLRWYSGLPADWMICGSSDSFSQHSKYLSARHWTPSCSQSIHVSAGANVGKHLGIDKSAEWVCKITWMRSAVPSKWVERCYISTSLAHITNQCFYAFLCAGQFKTKSDFLNTPQFSSYAWPPPFQTVQVNKCRWFVCVCVFCFDPLAFFFCLCIAISIFSHSPVHPPPSQNSLHSSLPPSALVLQEFTWSSKVPE